MVTKSISLPLTQFLLNEIEEMVFVMKVEAGPLFIYEFLNQAALSKMKWKQQVTGKKFSDVLNEDTAQFLEGQYKKVLITGESFTYEDSYIALSGERRYSESKMSPLFDDTGKCTHIISVVKDVTTEKVAVMEKTAAWNELKESKARYKSLFVNNIDLIFKLDPAGFIEDTNVAAERITGYSAEEMKGTPLSTYLTENVPEVMKYLRRAMNGISNEFKNVFLSKEQSAISCFIKFIPIEVQQQTVGVYAVLKDTRELTATMNKYIESEKRFRIIAENVHNVILLMNAEAEIVYISPSVADMYGTMVEEALGRSAFLFVHEDDQPVLQQRLEESLCEKKAMILELRLRHKTAGWAWSEIHATPIFDEHNEFVHMVIVFHDISSQKARETQLEFYAYHDSLTELPNRRFFTEQLSSILSRYQENYKEHLAVILLDVDSFKEVNDRLGHEVGDEVIKEFGKRLSGSVGNHFAARLGGDEFVVLLTGLTGEEQILAVVADIFDSLKKPWPHSELPLTVTTSMGVAVVTQPGHTFSAILKTADRAMYKAKEAGKNTYEIQFL